MICLLNLSVVEVNVLGKHPKDGLHRDFSQDFYGHPFSPFSQEQKLWTAEIMCQELSVRLAIMIALLHLT